MLQFPLHDSFNEHNMNSTFLYLQDQIDTNDIFKVLNENTSYIQDIAKKFQDCEDILVFATGGSCLGGKCLVNFQASLHGRRPRVSFIENVDSRTFLNAINGCDPESTGIIVISKSGQTTETLTLFLTVCELWNDFDYENRAIVITQFSEHNPLRMLAESKKMMLFEHNENIGGRFSVFSIVGLLPAFLEGVDVNAFTEGGRKVVSAIKNADSCEDCQIFQNIVTMNNVFDDWRIDQHVFMSYSDFMSDYGRWVAQLWAESLGKSKNFGITPLTATGTVDQHSLLQLFLGGPRNKLFTFIVQKENLKTPKIRTDIPKLDNKSIQDVMIAHQKATIEALGEVGYVRIFEFDELSIENLGFLMMMSFMEILTIAHLHQINPFDQPAVERAKKFVDKYLF